MQLLEEINVLFYMMNIWKLKMLLPIYKYGKFSWKRNPSSGQPDRAL